MSSRSSREQRDAELKAAEAKEKDQRASATQSAYEMMRAKLMAQGLIPASSTSAGTSSIPAASTATPALVVEPASVAAPANGALVVFGSTNWDAGAKPTETDESPNLYGPHRLVAGLNGVKIGFIASGSTSAHCVALGVDGAAYAWGKNNLGQLGVGDTATRPGPVPVAYLKGVGGGVVGAATGKAHTLWLARDGGVWASGAAKQGCVGGNAKRGAEYEAKPLRVTGLPTAAVRTRHRHHRRRRHHHHHHSLTHHLSPPQAVCCGTNFNLVRDADGGLWSFGWSEFGVLGNGTDGEHNLADGSVKLSYQAVSTPARIASLRDKKIVDAACGTAHCVAAASDGTVYTWGNGGYGRLGHRDQANLHTPKALPELKASRVSAGSAYTAALGWAVRRGRSRTHTMRRRRTQRPAHSTDASPPPLLRCSTAARWRARATRSCGCGASARAASRTRGCTRSRSRTSRGGRSVPPAPSPLALDVPCVHTPEPTRPPPPPPPQVHAFACGQNHSVLSADDSVIAWGHGTASGELGFGAGAKKSAARAEKVETLEKLRVAQVACGYAHTVLLADGDSDVVKRLPAWTPAPAKEAEAGPSGEKGGPPKKKAKK